MPTRVRAFLFVVALTPIAVETQAAAAMVDRDRTPPAFGGLKSATTCIPGPIGPNSAGRYVLRWQRATDNKTPSAKIVYLIYQATTSGGEDFSTPTYTTGPGVIRFRTPPLPSTQTFYFVVRSRDRAGNVDSNRIERQGQNLCV